MKTAIIATLVGASLLAGAYAQAQAPTRIRGTISALSGDVLAVNGSDGRKVDVQIGDKTNIVFAQPIPIAEIKPGDMIKLRCHRLRDGSNGCLLGFVTPMHGDAARGNGIEKKWD